MKNFQSDKTAKFCTTALPKYDIFPSHLNRTYFKKFQYIVVY